MDNGWPKHVIDGVRYSAHHIDGSTWMVKRYRSDDDADYVECLFQTEVKNELGVIQVAIENNSWA